MNRFSMSKKDYVFMILGLVAAILGVALSFWGGMKLGFTISVVLIFGIVTAYLFQGKLTVYGTICGILTLLEAGVFSYTVDALVNGFLVIAIFITAAIWFSSLRGYTENSGDFSLVPHVFASTFGISFGSIGKTFNGMFNSENKKVSGVWKVLVGILVSVPLLAIIIVLLSSADSAFEALLGNIADNIGKALLQILVGVITAPLLLSYMAGLRNTTKEGHTVEQKKGLSSPFVISFLAMLSLVYILYLFSQLAYLINGFAGILPQETTYAEYARRGFFEISFISGLNFLVLFLVLIITKKKEEKLPVVVTIESLFIALMNLFLVSTAMAKMLMYIKAYGLTQFRICTTGIMIFFGIVTIALIFRLFIKKVRVLRVAVVTAALVLLVLGYGDMDSKICAHNIKLYRAGITETNDCEVMYHLGLPGVPYLIDVYENDTSDSEKVMAEIELNSLCERYLNMYPEEGTDEVLYEPLKKEPGMWNYTYTRGIRMLQEWAKSHAENK